MNISPLARLFASTIADDTQPSDGVKRSSCNYGNWWRVALMGGLMLCLPTVGQAEPTLFTFTRVVDTSTEIPGGTGNFIFFTDPFANHVGGRSSRYVDRERNRCIFRLGSIRTRGHVCRRSWGFDNHNC